YQYVDLYGTSIVFTGFGKVENENGTFTLEWNTYIYDSFEDFLSTIEDVYQTERTTYGVYPSGGYEFEICNPLWKEDTSVTIIENDTEDVIYEMDFVDCEDYLEPPHTKCYCGDFFLRYERY